MFVSALEFLCRICVGSSTRVLYCFVSYVTHRNKKCGYLHNQVLFTNLAIHSEVYSKIPSAIRSSLLLTICLGSCLTTGSSTISNQLEAGLIMVRAIKSICKLSLPSLRVYRPMRSTHKHSQGFVMIVFGGRCPYLWDHLLLIWQDLQDFVSDWMVVRIPFQYISAFIVSLRRVCPGCCR